MPQDADELVTSAANTTLALIAHRQNETDLLTERARYIWDLAHVHGMSRRAIRDRLIAELRDRGVTTEQMDRMGIKLGQIHRIASEPRP